MIRCIIPLIPSVNNVLITCAGGAGSLLLAESLQRTQRVYLADANDLNTALSPRFPFRKIPFGSDPAFADALRSLIGEWNIDYVVPGADEELMPFHRLREEGLIACVMPRGAFVELCLHKKNLMYALDAEGISHLPSFERAEDVRYPAIAKPVFGRGSRQVHCLEHASHLQGYFALYDQDFSRTVVQPAVGGVEYTVSVVVSNRNVLIGVVPKRILEKRGITRSAVTEKNGIIAAVCQRIVEQFQPCGPFNVQLKLCDGVCSIFEINPRLSTTAVLTAEAFGNEIELYIRSFDQDPISLPPVMEEGVAMHRSEAHHFMRGST